MSLVGIILFAWNLFGFIILTNWVLEGPLGFSHIPRPNVLMPGVQRFPLPTITTVL